jgi:hypothetical protein
MRTGDKVSKHSVVDSQMDSIKLRTFVALTMDVISVFQLPLGNISLRQESIF